MSPYLPLSVAIVAEVVATTAMKSSDGFTRLWPSLIVVAGYMVAFYFLSMTFRTLPTGIAYAIWAGAGIVLCWRRFKIEPPCRLNFEPGLLANR